MFGIGSDIAGSIRIPCLFNGVFGHKPTGGTITNNGHFPNSDDSNCLHYLQMGPITRFARDLSLLLQIMMGPLAVPMDLLTPPDVSTIKVNTLRSTKVILIYLNLLKHFRFFILMVLRVSTVFYIKRLRWI